MLKDILVGELYSFLNNRERTDKKGGVIYG